MRKKNRLSIRMVPEFVCHTDREEKERGSTGTRTQGLLLTVPALYH